MNDFTDGILVIILVVISMEFIDRGVGIVLGVIGAIYIVFRIIHSRRKDKREKEEHRIKIKLLEIELAEKTKSSQS